MKIDFSKNQSFYNLESDCIDLIKYLVKNQFSKYKNWESLDLIPAIERHMYVLLLNDKRIFKKVIGKNQKINSKDLSLNISKFDNKTSFYEFFIKKIIDKVKYPSI